MRGTARVALPPTALAAALASALATALAAPASANVAEATFDYVYVEANEGGSSGGHAGIRAGHHIYHFQNEGGLLVLFREPADEFLYAYAMLSNRTVEVSRVGVSAATAEGIRSQLAKRHRAQEAQLDVLAALADDCALLEAMAAGEARVSVPGLGYFARTGDDPTRSPSLVALQGAVAAASRETFTTGRRAEILLELERELARDPAAWSAPPPASVYDHPPFSEPWSRRLQALAAGLAALDVLARTPTLDRSAVRAPEEPEFELTPDERTAMSRQREALASQLVRTFRSPSSDWGRVALVGMARLAAIDESLATNRIVVLDSLPEDGDRIDRRSVTGRAALMTDMLLETRRELEVARSSLARAEDPSELVFERYEERANRHLELRSAIRHGADVRVARGHLIPARPASLELEVSEANEPPDRLGTRSVATFAASLERVRERHRRYAHRLDHLHRYELITRNCVSALFETLNDALGDDPERAAAAVGGFVDGRSGLGFIPFVSAAQVDARFRVVAREVIPSYRRKRLDEMEREGAGLFEMLRESNTLTASTYQRAERDSFFVFFTEDATLLRPLYGAVNLVGAVGETALGLLKLPFDRGRTFLLGLEGAVVSLPELAFVNIRKGSNDWIAPEFRAWKPEPRS